MQKEVEALEVENAELKAQASGKDQEISELKDKLDQIKVLANY